jgi:hypothetical protein
VAVAARTPSPVLTDLDRYAFELLLVSYFAEREAAALPARVLGPSPHDVSARASPLRGTPQAAALRAFVDAHRADVRRCLVESATFTQARGRIAAWVRRSLPAAAAEAARPEHELVGPAT